MNETASAFDIMVALVVLTAPFWGGGLLIGYLVRNKQGERQYKSHLQERMDLAAAEQRLYNLRREQRIADELADLRHDRQPPPEVHVIFGDAPDEPPRQRPRLPLLHKILPKKRSTNT